MDKVKFIGYVIAGVVFAYLLLTILMPLFVSTSTDAAASVNSSPNAASYATSVAGLQYAPLVLYLLPAAVGITAIVYKLKVKK